MKKNPINKSVIVSIGMELGWVLLFLLIGNFGFFGKGFQEIPVSLFMPCLASLAIILGWRSYKEIKSSEGKTRGIGFAILSIVFGSLMLMINCLYIYIGSLGY